MAGITVGAAASKPLPPHTACASSRTRRNHGAFLIGDELGTVCSTRRRGVAHGVLLQIGEGSLTFNGAMSAAQARAMAHALNAAAEAVEAMPLPIVEEVSVPANDEADGIAWWNSLTDRGRGLWLEAAGTATPADAWAYFKTIRDKFFGLTTGSEA